MKLILDEGMPLRTASLLRAKSIEAEHVLELDMGGASDEAILKRGRKDQAVVVTLDADFHQILAATGASSPSTIRVRMEGLGAEQLATLLLRVLSQTQDELSAGVAVSVTRDSLRLRRLPLRT